MAAADWARGQGCLKVLIVTEHYSRRRHNKNNKQEAARPARKKGAGAGKASNPRELAYLLLARIHSTDAFQTFWSRASFPALHWIHGIKRLLLKPYTAPCAGRGCLMPLSALLPAALLPG